MSNTLGDDSVGVLPDSYIHGGLTKRELFAIEMMKSVMQSDQFRTFHAEDRAYHAVKYADALIVALNKEVQS